MADKIRISSSDLEAQAVKLKELSQKLYDVRANADKAVKMIEEATISERIWFAQLTSSKLIAAIGRLGDMMSDGARIATQAAASYENTDKVIRDLIGDQLPDDVKNSATSGQTVVEPLDESIYDQTAYSQFMEHYDYDYDGDIDYINTGCVITSCAYALTRMGIITTPLQAYERSGGCYAYYDKISQGQAYITTNQPVSMIDEMAKKAKNDPNNISPLLLRVNGNTHTVVLKDIEMDAAGNITKYVVFDPYKAATKEYTSISQMKVSSFNYYTRA